MHEILLVSGRRKRVPGAGTPVGSYQDPNNSARKTAFYGEVPAAEFPFTSSLYSRFGTPNRQNPDTPWLKFGIDGKLLFTPKLSIASGISWSSLYASGMVYGTTDTGPNNNGTPTTQNAAITISNMVFKVRLWSMFNGVAKLPYTGNYTKRTEMIGSEWSRLMPNISSKTGYGNQEGPKWAAYDEVNDLGFAGTSGTGGLGIGQEFVDANDGAKRSTSMFQDFFSTGAPIITDVGNYIAWRPVLELVNN